MQKRSAPRLVRYSLTELDRYLFFNPASASVVVTNNRGARIIEDWVRQEVGTDPFLDRLQKTSIFDQAIDDTGYGGVPERLIVELTSACNLRCKTCYMSAAVSGANELTTQEVRSLLHEASELGTKTVAFIGGEPFIRKDLQELVEFAVERFADVQISTNGTISDRGFLTCLSKKENVTIQVSLDGADETANDAIRGQGSFTRAVEFLDSAKDAGFRTSISSVLNKYNYNRVGAVCDFAFGKGCYLAIIHKVHVFGRAEEFPDIVPSGPELMHGMGVLLRKQDQYERPGKMIVDFPHNRCFRGDPYLDASFLGCHFGRAFAYITSDGNLVCCSHLRQEGFVYGNIRESSLIDLWQGSSALDRMRKLTVEDIAACRECQFKYMCRGSCRADALGYSGDICGKPYDCETLRGYYAYVLDHLARNAEQIIPEEG